MFPCISPSACFSILRSSFCAKPTYQLSLLAGISKFSGGWVPAVRNRLHASSTRAKARAQ